MATPISYTNEDILAYSASTFYCYSDIIDKRRTIDTVTTLQLEQVFLSWGQWSKFGMR